MVVVEGTPPALHGIGGGVSRCFECGFDDSKFEIFLIYCLPSTWTVLTVHHHLRFFSVLSLHPLLPTFFLCPHSFSAHILSLPTLSRCTLPAQPRIAARVPPKPGQRGCTGPGFDTSRFVGTGPRRWPRWWPRWQWLWRLRRVFLVRGASFVSVEGMLPSGRSFECTRVLRRARSKGRLRHHRGR